MAQPFAGLVEGSDGWSTEPPLTDWAGYGTIFKITTNGVFTRCRFYNVNGATAAAELVEGNEGTSTEQLPMAGVRGTAPFLGNAQWSPDGVAVV